MKKYRYLLKNIGLLTISSFGTKLITFFLVPLYTSILTTQEYGTYDLFNTTISLLIPILTINIQDGVLRFSLGADREKTAQVFSYGVKLVGVSSLLICIFAWVNQYFCWVKIFAEYPLFFVLLYITTSYNQIFMNIARGVDRVADISIAGVISALTGCLLNIWLLVFVKIGLNGYFIAAIGTALAPCIYLGFRLHLGNYLRRNTDEQLRKDMLAYSAPLVLNAIGWWINSASDRYIVTWICGVAANGIYSVGYKIPSILNVFQTIFNQAWVLSSVKEFDPEDKDGFFVNIYNVYEFLMVGVCALLIVFTRSIARILYAKEFYNAWVYVPFLTISIVFGALSGLIGGVFAAAKDSKVFSISTLVGAAVNTALNMVLVFAMGPMGAAIATAISYTVVWAIRLICVKRHMTLRVKLGRDIASYVVLGALTGILFLPISGVVFVIFSVALLSVLVWLYRGEAKQIVRKIKNK